MTLFSDKASCNFCCNCSALFLSSLSWRFRSLTWNHNIKIDDQWWHDCWSVISNDTMADCRKEVAAYASRNVPSRPTLLQRKRTLEDLHLLPGCFLLYISLAIPFNVRDKEWIRASLYETEFSSRDEFISVSGHFLVAVYTLSTWFCMISSRDELIPGRFHPCPKHRDETWQKRHVNSLSGLDCNVMSAQTKWIQLGRDDLRPGIPGWTRWNCFHPGTKRISDLM